MENNQIKLPQGMEILGEEISGIEKILTQDCLEFILDLENKFGDQRKELLEERTKKQKE